VVTLPAGTEMVMPGTTWSMEIALITPIAMDEGLRFAIRTDAPAAPAVRHQNQTSRHHEKIPHSPEGVRSPAARPVREGVRRDREAYRRRVAGRFRCARIERFTVNRSPHVDKKSASNSDEKPHKRLLDILEPTQQTIDALGKLDLAAAFDVEIKLQ